MPVWPSWVAFTVFLVHSWAFPNLNLLLFAVSLVMKVLAILTESTF